MAKLGFGMMRLPVKDAQDIGSIDKEEVCRLTDRFLERGFTYFDTAWMYHDCKSEECVKECVVSRNLRKSFTLTDKLPSYMIKSFDDRDNIIYTQLERTGAGYFDVYLLHSVDNTNISIFEKYDCFRWLIQKKENGFTKHIGFSFHGSPELLERLLTEYPEFEYVQLQINYLDWEHPVVQSRACYETCVRHNKKVIIMEPVKGGRLARLPKQAEDVLRAVHPDWSPASWALRFAAGLENVEFVLSGMGAMEQVEENTALFADMKPLTAEEKKVLERVTEIIYELTAIHCTGCSYCTAECPQKIRIPGLFSTYNNDKLEGTYSGKDANLNRYKKLTAEVSPADCIKCGACESICPQHLPVRELLETVSAHFEMRMASCLN